jgi:hypothetical protein
MLKFLTLSGTAIPMAGETIEPLPQQGLEAPPVAMMDIPDECKFHYVIFVSNPNSVVLEDVQFKFNDGEFAGFLDETPGIVSVKTKYPPGFSGPIPKVLSMYAKKALPPVKAPSGDPEGEGKEGIDFIELPVPVLDVTIMIGSAGSNKGAISWTETMYARINPFGKGGPDSQAD